jgi:hypothetical protein
MRKDLNNNSIESSNLDFNIEEIERVIAPGIDTDLDLDASATGYSTSVYALCICS